MLAAVLVQFEIELHFLGAPFRLTFANFAFGFVVSQRAQRIRKGRNELKRQLHPVLRRKDV
jgi:hypothetical protein